jgi:hypothetical protein
MASYYYTNDPRNQSIPMNPMNTDQRSREASTNTAHGGRHIPGRYNTASGTQSIAPGGNHIPGGNRAVSGSGAGYMPDGNRTASESQNTAHGGRHIPGRYNTASGTQSITPGGNHIPGGYRAASGSGAGYMPAGNRTTSESQNTRTVDAIFLAYIILQIEAMVEIIFPAKTLVQVDIRAQVLRQHNSSCRAIRQ